MYYTLWDGMLLVYQLKMLLLIEIYIQKIGHMKILNL